jgi:hypothetical protein
VGSTADHENWSFDINSGGLALENLQTGQINESCTPADYYLSGGNLSLGGPYPVARDGSFTINASFSSMVDSDPSTVTVNITGRISGGIASGTYKVNTAFTDQGTAYNCSTGNQTWSATLTSSSADHAQTSLSAFVLTGQARNRKK